MSRPKVIAIVGPTSSGKSALGVYLAKKIGGEIISADSRQVYKNLNIGTGKITKLEMHGVPHHLLDISSPKKQFTASDFVTLARRAYFLIRANKRIPIVVGGTGFYIDAFLGRLSLPNVPPNPPLRAKQEKKSTKQLFAQLKKLDPRRAKNIEPNHKRRLIRAIEIAKAIGKSPAPSSNVTYNILWIGILPDPKKLKKNISTRLKSRIKTGMITEARRLHKSGVSYKRMNELGLEYHYLALLLQKKLNQMQFEEQLESSINKYAKRQIRWFKRNKDIVWVRTNTEVLRLAKKFLSR